MLHSVLPPEPPAIVEPLLAENLPIIAASDRQLHSRGEQAKAETLQQQPFNSSHQPVTDQSFTVKTPTIPAPESFPAEFSPLNITENSADLLGEPLSIGYSQQEPQITQDTNNSSQKRQTQQQIVQTIKNSKNRSQKKSQLLAEQLVQSKQNHTTAKNSQTSSSAPQPIKIKFRTANQQSATNNQLSTIEFKTRNLTSQAPQPAPTPTTPETRRVVEVIADTQEYDEQRRVVTAEGNVVVRFDGAVVDADRIQVSLDNLIAVGEGNVALTR
ncbi:organic solvent tolerance protein OstA, partial [Fischerella thermalis WC213]